MNEKEKEYWKKIAWSIYAKGKGTVREKNQMWTRACSRKTFTEFFLNAMNEIISIDMDTGLDTNTVLKYNKAELKKDLIKQIKSGKADAARILADLDNMRNSTDEYLIITVDYSQLPELNVEKLLDEEAERRDQKSFLDDEED